jgi:hypothetical protein
MALGYDSRQEQIMSSYEYSQEASLSIMAGYSALGERQLASKK